VAPNGTNILAIVSVGTIEIMFICNFCNEHNYTTKVTNSWLNKTARGNLFPLAVFLTESPVKNRLFSLAVGVREPTAKIRLSLAVYLHQPQAEIVISIGACLVGSTSLLSLARDNQNCL
jgi:hypothetical protein